MEPELIEELADAFAEQLNRMEANSEYRKFIPAVLEDIVAVGIVINRNEPTYDMRYFYRRAGYPAPYPVHEMY